MLLVWCHLLTGYEPGLVQFTASTSCTSNLHVPVQGKVLHRSEATYLTHMFDSSRGLIPPKTARQGASTFRHTLRYSDHILTHHPKWTNAY